MKSTVSTSVFAALCLASVNAEKIPRETDFGCTWMDGATERSCKYLKQQNKCDLGEEYLVDVTFKGMQICENVQVDEGLSYLELKGSSLVLPPNQGKPLLIKPSDMTRRTVVGDCTVFEYDQKLDTCKPGLFAELYLEGNDKDTGLFEFGVYKFHEFMLQNCKFGTSITCTGPDGTRCENMSDCMDGNYTYEFCYETQFQEHDITIRPNKMKCDAAGAAADPEGCRETHAYINTIGQSGQGGIWVQAFGNVDNVPNEKIIGYSGVKKVCKKKVISVNTCVSTFIPGAYINAVGSVTANFDKGRSFQRYKACFSNAQFRQKKLDAQDVISPTTRTASSPTSSPTVACDEDTGTGRKLKVASGKPGGHAKVAKGCKKSKGSKAPSSKGSKAPSSKAKAPTVGAPSRRTLRKRL